MTETAPPGKDEFELTLLGPGYGESIVLHVGGGVWVLVDSCLNTDGTPGALSYLESIGVDPAQAVDLIVATHWHDDHIRGMAQLVETCDQAAFCCASVLCREEFLSAIDALERHHLSVAGSGVREFHSVLSRLAQVASGPTYALANRRILSREACEIWSLSPNDSAFQNFLRSIGGLVPGEGQAKRRIPSLFPNEVSVVLWIKVNDVAVLLGSDLAKLGWIEILLSTERPTSKASVFKVPHHGSEDAHAPEVWNQMLDAEPFAVLTPWRRGGHSLPSQRDVRRILSNTTNAYATARIGALALAPSGRDRMVERTLRESGVKLRQLAMLPGAVRLRRPLGSQTRWKVEKFGSACHLDDFAKQ